VSTPLARVTRVMEEVTGVKSLYGIDAWTWGFLETIAKRAPETLTERQEKVLSEIERKVFGEVEEA
jgi:hypothetical protein